MFFSRTLKFVTLLAMVASIGIAAEEVREMTWEDFVPPTDNRYDWIQLKSGEWLKGEIKVMYSFTLEFDSDELDLLELELDDIKQIRSADVQRVLVERRRRDTEVLSGKLVLDGEDLLLIKEDEENIELKRHQLVSIAGGYKRERDNWSGNLSVGATLRGGNTETMDISTSANLRRRTAMSRLNLDYLSNYSEVQTTDSSTGEKATEETANNQRLNGYFDWFLTARLYWQIVNAEYYRDPFVNIRDQYSVNSAVGYDIIHTSRTEWTLNVGAGYQETEFFSVQEGEDSRSGSPFSTAGLRFDHEISGNLDFLFDYSGRLLNEANGKYTHHIVTTLSYEFIGDLDLDISLVWDRIEKPTPTEVDDGSGGTISSTPEQDDYQLIVGLAYEF